MNSIYVIEKRQFILNKEKKPDLILLDLLHLADSLTSAEHWVKTHASLPEEEKNMNGCFYFCFLAPIDNQIDLFVEENSLMFDEYGHKV